MRLALLDRSDRSWLLSSLRQRGRQFPPRRTCAERFGDFKAGAQAVLMETITGPGATEPGMAAALDFAKPLLCGKGGGIILRVFADVFAEGERGLRLERRIEADEQRLAFVNALQAVHPVGDRDIVDGRALALPAQEIPRRPGAPALRHQARIA